MEYTTTLLFKYADLLFFLELAFLLCFICGFVFLAGALFGLIRREND